MAGYEVDQATGCWVWHGETTSNGYGLVESGNRREGTRVRRVVHRVEWERLHGPVPDGQVLDHLCRERLCCNPAHLELVTHVENVRRGVGTKLTAADVLAIRASSAGPTALGERYGVSPGTICDVRTRRSWADLDAAA